MWARRVLAVLGGLWLATTIVPLWFIGGFLLVAITGVVLSAKPTPWGAGIFFLVLDLAWLAATVGVIRFVVRRKRGARRSRVTPE